jgi:hypothetical protein
VTTQLPAAYVAYLARRDAERSAAAAGAFEALTERERLLVKEAAVMGYVRGTMAPKGEKIPKDGAIVAEVIDACLAMPDLYPTLTAYVADDGDDGGEAS